MPYEVLLKKAHELVDAAPPEKIEWVVGVLEGENCLKNYAREIPSSKKGFGCMHDENFWMADDFDQTPECFKDYV